MTSTRAKCPTSSSGSTKTNTKGLCPKEIPVARKRKRSRRKSTAKIGTCKPVKGSPKIKLCKTSKGWRFKRK